MNFKRGDIVWCIDPNNNNNRYTATHYHRKCVVVLPDSLIDGFMQVQCLSQEKDESEYVLYAVWDVEKKFFAHVQQKVVIL